MDLIAKLHSAARLYLIERGQIWREKYTEVQRKEGDRVGRDYSDEAKNIFPRFTVLDSILLEIERYTYKDFESVREEKDLIIAAVGQAENLHFSPDPVEWKAVREEKNRFIEYLKGLSDSDLERAECIFYRRVLSPEEASRKKSLLKTKWEIWLWSSDTDENIVGFQQDSFNTEVDVHEIQNLLRKRNVERVLELREYGANYEFDISVFEPIYKGPDIYYTSEEMDWIMFVSHMGLIIVGGWLLDDLKQIWPKWDSNLWVPGSLKD